VGLVEAVAGELLHQVEDVRGPRPLCTPLRRPVGEDRALLGHLLGFFAIAGGRSPHQGIAREALRNLHDLLLVRITP
jgi:hypothetical protein